MMTSKGLVLEVCVDSIRSAVSAAKAGVDRLEVCGNLGIGGGTTPSLGLVRGIQRAAMVRPRTGDFLYSEEELDVMLEDIGLFKSVGIAGVVFGVLNRDGTVDVPRTRMCVFDFAFAMLRLHRSLQAPYDAICTIPGITRVLTSGQSSTSVLMGVPVLQELLQRSQTSNGPAILPGAGINPGSISAVLGSLLPYGPREIHMSGGRWTESETAHRSEGMGMGTNVQREWGIWLTDSNSVREVRSIADSSVNSA
ncbi:Copper homeostasis CutC domain containing protein [Lactarius tabidus]